MRVRVRYYLKLFLLYLFVIFMYLATPICLFAVINIGVSIKYEVDEALIFVDINQKLNRKEKIVESKMIRKHGKNLKLEQSLWIVATIALPVGATTVLFNKKRLIGVNI